jgi:hypothetical protein
VTLATKAADSSKISGASLSRVATWKLFSSSRSVTSRLDTSRVMIGTEEESTTWSSTDRKTSSGWVIRGRSAISGFHCWTKEWSAFSGVLGYGYSLPPGFLMSLPIAGKPPTACLSSGSASRSLRRLASAGFTTTMPATWSPRSAASRSAIAPPMGRPPTTTASTSARSLSKVALMTPYQSAKVVLLASSHVVPWPGSSGTSTAYPWSARYRPHGFIEVGLPVRP